MQSLQPKSATATGGDVGDSAAAPHAAATTRQRTMDSMLSSMATTVTLQSYNGTVIDEGDMTGLQGSDMLPVYQLSAKTGSAMYMAPEVFKGGCCCCNCYCFCYCFCYCYCHTLYKEPSCRLVCCCSHGLGPTRIVFHSLTSAPLTPCPPSCRRALQREGRRLQPGCHHV